MLLLFLQNSANKWSDIKYTYYEANICTEILTFGFSSIVTMTSIFSSTLLFLYIHVKRNAPLNGFIARDMA